MPACRRPPQSTWQRGGQAPQQGASRIWTPGCGGGGRNCRLQIANCWKEPSSRLWASRDTTLSVFLLRPRPAPAHGFRYLDVFRPTWRPWATADETRQQGASRAKREGTRGGAVNPGPRPLVDENGAPAARPPRPPASESFSLGDSRPQPWDVSGEPVPNDASQREARKTLATASDRPLVQARRWLRCPVSSP